jgi:hypothetical protein
MEPERAEAEWSVPVAEQKPASQALREPRQGSRFHGAAHGLAGGAERRPSESATLARRSGWVLPGPAPRERRFRFLSVAKHHNSVLTVARV